MLVMSLLLLLLLLNRIGRTIHTNLPRFRQKYVIWESMLNNTDQKLALVTIFLRQKDASSRFKDRS